MSETRLSEVRLARAMSCGVPVDVMADYVRQAADLSDRLEAHRASDRAERYEIAAFFAGRGSHGPETAAARADLRRAARALLMGDDDAQPEDAPASGGGFRIGPLDAALGPSELAMIMTETSGRIVAVDRHHRIAAISRAEAEVAGLTPARTLGLRLSEFSGTTWFDDTVRIAVEAAFDGRETLVHLTSPDVFGEATPLTCRVQPIEDGTAIVYAALLTLSSATGPNRE